MRATRRALPSLVWALVCLLFGSVRAADKVFPSSSFIGQWEVERVLPDQADRMRWTMRTNSPAMMFRRFVITDSTVVFDGAACQQRWVARSSTWGELFRMGFLRTAGHGRSVHPEPEDFDLAMSKETRVKAYALCFTPKVKSPWLRGQWVVFEGPDRMIMHADETLIFVLRRVPEGEPPHASFPCAEAATPTEKAICGSAELANWDRSVAEALRQLPKSVVQADELIAEQPEWLRARDQCGADVACLETSMRNRTSDLASW